jgi:hypothetical protein
MSDNPQPNFIWLYLARILAFVFMLFFGFAALYSRWIMVAYLLTMLAIYMRIKVLERRMDRRRASLEQPTSTQF